MVNGYSMYIAMFKKNDTGNSISNNYYVHADSCTSINGFGSIQSHGKLENPFFKQHNLQKMKIMVRIIL